MDRFLTTVLMIDMVGSTELAAELGDRGWRELVQAPKVVSEMLGRSGCWDDPERAEADVRRAVDAGLAASAESVASQPTTRTHLPGCRS